MAVRDTQALCFGSSWVSGPILRLATLTRTNVVLNRNPSSLLAISRSVSVPGWPCEPDCVRDESKVGNHDDLSTSGRCAPIRRRVRGKGHAHFLRNGQWQVQAGRRLSIRPLPELLPAVMHTGPADHDRREDRCDRNHSGRRGSERSGDRNPGLYDLFGEHSLDLRRRVLRGGAQTVREHFRYRS